MYEANNYKHDFIYYNKWCVERNTLYYSVAISHSILIIFNDSASPEFTRPNLI